MSHEERSRTYYHAIETELDRRGIDYEIHGLPGADDIVRFEEYWLTNLTPATKIFPAIVDADAAEGLAERITRALRVHEAEKDTRVYRVVLCGNGWTEERTNVLRQQVAAGFQGGILWLLEPLGTFAVSP